ncbi:MAG: hypothetical protein GPJ54_22345 [Candidatus Heimdallarchaeota archaeon]|nr:hypothetical protein [Candidatus Heimdallarchaeota archaeon]
MSKSTKKLISQRWDQQFTDKVRNIATKLDITSTDLTIESLKFIISLVDSNPTIMSDASSRGQYLQDIINYGPISPKITNSSNKEKTKEKKESGFIIDRLANYLKHNQNQTFSSIELAELLNIPQPTVRTYIRNLAESDKKFKLIKGRPNFIGYFDK